MTRDGKIPYGDAKAFTLAALEWTTVQFMANEVNLRYSLGSR